MGRLSSILQKRSPVLWVFSPEQTVAEAIRAMAERQVGVVPIVASGRLVGIFSERDLLRRVVAKGRDPEKTLLAEVMTPDPVTAAPGEDRITAIDKMQAIGCRHLPIEVNGTVIDMLSMRDLLYQEIQEKAAEVAELRHYVSGSY
jgi:CBS domain-containing protein